MNDHAGSVITAVEKQSNKPRYHIYLDGEYRLSVHEDVLVKHRLMKGSRVNERQLTRILRDEELQKAIHAALRYAGRRARSIYEVKQKLSSLSYEEELAEEAVACLQRQGVLNDEKYAIELAEYRFFSQKKGKKWIEQELKHKGIAAEYIQRALNKFDQEDETEQALALAEKKWNSVKGDDLDKKRKTYSFLLRRGFSPDSARQAVQKAASSASGNADEEDFYHLQ